MEWVVRLGEIQLPLPEFVCGPDGSKFKMAKPFGPSHPPSKLGLRSPIRTAKAGSGTTAFAINTSTEIRVCVNRTCRRQGSMEILQILAGISPPDVIVKSCGCLGRCGAGPNLVVLPQATFVGHCGTAARAAETMLNVCGGNPQSWSNSLAALALRKRAEDLLGKGNSAFDAERLLTQAIDLKPLGGIHFLYKDRSSVRLMLGNTDEALEDAKEAINLAPKYPEAYISQGDVLMAKGQFDAAEKSYVLALELDPSIRRSKSFKARIANLQEKLTASDLT